MSRGPDAHLSADVQVTFALVGLGADRDLGVTFSAFVGFGTVSGVGATASMRLGAGLTTRALRRLCSPSHDECRVGVVLAIAQRRGRIFVTGLMLFTLRGARVGMVLWLGGSPCVLHNEDIGVSEASCPCRMSVLVASPSMVG